MSNTDSKEWVSWTTRLETSGGANDHQIWISPNTGTYDFKPYESSAMRPVEYPSDLNQLTAVQELMKLREMLSSCMICGQDEVFVFCDPCRQILIEARKDVLRRMCEDLFDE